MVERRLLTPEYVNNAVPPARGERWVADTKQRGFGLRLWATKSGGQKALVIRVVDAEGRSFRRAFNVTQQWQYRIDYLHTGFPRHILLGDYLEEARAWARDQIDLLKKRPTLKDEEDERYSETAKRVRKLQFGHAAEVVCKGMKRRGLSEDYVDKVQKLFSTYVPQSLKLKALQEVTAGEIIAVLSNRKISWSNARTLRSFVSQVFLNASNFSGILRRVPSDLSRNSRIRAKKDRSEKAAYLVRLKESKYERLFKVLEGDEEHWQQALCLRLYFTFGCPLRWLMRARWDQFADQRWFPVTPEERKYWRAHVHRVNSETQEILNRLQRHASTSGVRSQYLFPSPQFNGSQPITSVEAAWRLALKKLGLRQYSPRAYALRYRPQITISYNGPHYPLHDEALLKGLKEAFLSRV